MNAFLNQNALEVISELEESIGESLAQIFKNIMNNVFSKIPTDLWLLTEEGFQKYQSEQKELNN